MLEDEDTLAIVEHTLYRATSRVPYIALAVSM